MNIGGARLRWWWAFPAVAFALMVVFLVILWADRPRHAFPVLGDVPSFTMTDQDGRPFGRDSMLGRITVVDFIFTSCPGACPIMGDNLVRIYRAFKGTGRVRCVSISVDPAADSLPALRAYAAGWGVNDDGWVFLRAPLDSVVWLCEKGFMMPADDLPAGHTTRFTLVDRDGRIRGYYDGLDSAAVAQLERDIVRLGGE